MVAASVIETIRGVIRLLVRVAVLLVVTDGAVDCQVVPFEVSTLPLELGDTT